MLRSMKDLDGYAIHATDGDIGKVTDFYFDDDTWVIRYFVVDTGSWLSSRKVLISPISIGRPNWVENVLPVSITKQQVQDSPPIDTQKPVSRQHEIELLRYYGYPLYWGGMGVWDAGVIPGMMMPGYDGATAAPHVDRLEREAASTRADVEVHGDEDIHLRSCSAVMDYHIVATDGEIGHVQGLLVDEESWAIRYMIVNTSNWWLGHQVLIAPQWIKDVRWSGATVTVDQSRQAVKDAPPYDATRLLNRKDEMAIFKHYGHTPYWGD
jgi:hypothetical protein